MAVDLLIVLACALKKSNRSFSYRPRFRRSGRTCICFSLALPLICFFCIFGSAKTGFAEHRERVQYGKEGVKQGGEVEASLREAEKLIEERDFRKARVKIESVLRDDIRNREARKMMAFLDQQEALARQERRPSFFERIFSSGKDDPSRISHGQSSSPRPDGNRQKDFTRYMDEARSLLEAEEFTPARHRAARAFELSGGDEQAKELIAHIDTAEGLFREKHAIPSDTSARRRLTPAEEYFREREKYEARKKAEDLELRYVLIKARQYANVGEYEKARKKAYEAWKKIPYDQEVAMLIADINKGLLGGSKSPYEGLADDELVEHIFDPEKDPLLRHEEGKSYPDLGPIAVRKIRSFLDEKTYERDYVYPTERYSLDDCVEIALRLSQRMIFADEQVKLGEMRIWELRRKLFPDVALKVERSYGKIADSTRLTEGEPDVQEGATRHYQGKKYAVDIRQTVFDGFGTYFEIQQAQTNLEVIKKERDRIRNDIMAETKRAYYNYEKAIKSYSIQENLAQVIADMHRITEQAFELGLVPEVEYLKLKGQHFQAEFQRVSSLRDMDLAYLILVQAMNLDPDRNIEIEPLDPPEELLTIGLQNCYNLAIANNPDLKTKELTIQYYEFDRKIAKSRGWPKVDFMGTFGKAMENYRPMRYPSDWAGSNPIRAHRELESEWYAGLQAKLPLWGSTFEYNYVREIWAPTVSAFRGTESATSYFTLNILDDLGYFTGVQETRVGFERAKYEYQKAKNDLGLQVKTTYFRYRKALLQMDVARAQLEHQKMYVEVLNRRRELGEVEMSRVAEEYVKLAENEYGKVHGHTDYYLSIVDLNFAIGVMGYFDPWEPSFEKRKSRSEDIAGRYLSMAKAELARNRFEDARDLVFKASEISGSRAQIKELLGQIDRSEAIHRQSGTFSRDR